MKSCKLLLPVILFLLFGCFRKERNVVFSAGGAPNEIEFWETILKDFEKESGIQVSILRQPTDSDLRRQSILVPLKAGKEDPDVFLMDIAWISQFASADWLEDLAPAVEKDKFDLSVLWPNILDFADRFNGKLAALPVYVDAGLLYYRADLLKKYGFKSPPGTWEELVSYSIKIQNDVRKTKPDFFGFVWQGSQYEGLICNFLEFAGSNNGGLKINDSGIKINTKENLEALKFMTDLIHKTKISPPNTFTEMKEEEVRMFFQQGNALFERNWPYAWGLHSQEGSPVKGRVGIAPLPRFKKGKSVSTLGGWHIAISKYSDRKEDAWKFVKFIVSKETQKLLSMKLGWNPSRMDVYKDKNVLSVHPHFAELGKIFTNAMPRPNLPYYTQVSELMQKSINAVISGKKEPEEALAGLEKDIEKLSARYK
ncbi:MAG: ABC transporter substrate-binding protein [Elusimicrobia bacterium]|nr:ABC transporter substrate-binding protein [Elusimicrobiota bacterium]